MTIRIVFAAVICASIVLRANAQNFSVNGESHHLVEKKEGFENARCFIQDQNGFLFEKQRDCYILVAYMGKQKRIGTLGVNRKDAGWISHHSPIGILYTHKNSRQWFKSCRVNNNNTCCFLGLDCSAHENK